MESQVEKLFALPWDDVLAVTSWLRLHSIEHLNTDRAMLAVDVAYPGKIKAELAARLSSVRK